ARRVRAAEGGGARSSRPSGWPMSERTETRMLDIAVLRASFRRDVGVSREQLARAVGISEATLERLVRAGIVEPDTADAARFSAASAARLERLLRLHHDLEIDLV